MTADLNADLAWSARALELAAKADDRTCPNPMVGALVIDRQGQLAGEGYHAGEPPALITRWGRRAPHRSSTAAT